MPDKQIGHIFAYIAKAADAVDEENARITFTISTDKLDRQGEIVKAEAVAEAVTRPGEFRENPVALASHLHRLSDGMPPAVGSWDIDSLRQTNHRVQLTLQFAVDTKLGDQYWRLYSKRHMRAVSIGFRILDGHEEVKDKQRIYIITKIELFEISCVAVGANPQALSKLKEFYLSEKRENDLTPYAQNGITGPSVLLESDHTIADEIKKLSAGIEEIKEILVGDSGDLANGLLLGDPFDAVDLAADEVKKAEQIVSKLNDINSNFQGENHANTG